MLKHKHRHSRLYTCTNTLTRTHTHNCNGPLLHYLCHPHFTEAYHPAGLSPTTTIAQDYHVNHI